MHGRTKAREDWPIYRRRVWYRLARLYRVPKTHAKRAVTIERLRGKHGA